MRDPYHSCLPFLSKFPNLISCRRKCLNAKQPVHLSKLVSLEIPCWEPSCVP
ncbi:hypothetical protein K443DRAFT_334564, partial [Laccaria amethystina LaAM-08-1]